MIVTGQGVEDAKAAVARLEAQTLEQRSAAATQPFSTLREKGDIEDSLAEIAQRRAQYALGRGYAVKAPIAGRITAIQANVGQFADPTKPMAAIIPTDAKLVAVAYVASRGVGFLRVGQVVRIRYDAFPYQKFGSVTGRIASISQVALRPEDLTGTVRVEEPVYPVTIALDQQELVAFGEHRPLHAGMALRADLVLDRHNLVSTILEPLLARGWSR